MSAAMIRTGCDVVLIDRIGAQMHHGEFLERTFHVSERHGASVNTLAGIFALKEAAMKALELPTDAWLDIEVSNDKNGRPMLSFAPAITPKNMLSTDCSVSHDGAYAFAVVTALLTS